MESEIIDGWGRSTSVQLKKVDPKTGTRTSHGTKGVPSVGLVLGTGKLTGDGTGTKEKDGSVVHNQGCLLEAR